MQFTKDIKFPPGTKVFFAETNGAYLPSFHPHIYTGTVAAFSIAADGSVLYQFDNRNHARSEAEVFATPEEVITWLEESIDQQVFEMKKKLRELLDYQIEPQYSR